MTDAVQIALIATIPPTVAAIAGIIVSLINKNKLNKQAHEIQGVKDATNGMKDELVDVSSKAEHAEGILEGVAKEKAERRAGKDERYGDKIVVKRRN